MEVIRRVFFVDEKIKSNRKKGVIRKTVVQAEVWSHYPTTWQ